MLEKGFKPILIRLNYNFSSTFCGFALPTEKDLKFLWWHQRPLEYDLNLSIQNSFVIYFFTVGTLWSDCTQSFLNMFSAFKPLIIDSCHPLSWSVICPIACSQKKKSHLFHENHWWFKNKEWLFESPLNYCITYTSPMTYCHTSKSINTIW